MKRIVPASLAIFICLAVMPYNASYFEGEVASEKKSQEWITKEAKIYLEDLPQESGKIPSPVKEEEGVLSVRRSFLVKSNNKSMLSHAVADVEYTAIVIASEGKYNYKFGDFKVFPRQRDRYGKYSRSSSRGKSMDKLSKSLKPLVGQAIQQRVPLYVEKLKQQLQ